MPRGICINVVSPELLQVSVDQENFFLPKREILKWNCSLHPWQSILPVLLYAIGLPKAEVPGQYSGGLWVRYLGRLLSLLYSYQNQKQSKISWRSFKVLTTRIFTHSWQPRYTSSPTKPVARSPPVPGHKARIHQEKFIF